MRRAGLVALALVLGACSADPAAEKTPAPTGSAATGVLDLGDQEAGDWPVLDTGLAPRIPADTDDLPSLLDDPPGRALLSYHAPEPLGIGAGWRSETLLFLGTDGDWRRLRLDGLGLPDDRYAVTEGYGAGALSPDGRWWLGPAHPGSVLVDLETGAAELVAAGAGFSSWLPDSSGFLAQVARGSATFSIETGAVVRAPYDAWQVGIDPDLQQVSLRRAGDETELIEWRGDRPEVVGRIPVELTGADDRPFGPHVTDGRAAFVNGPNADYVITVVDTERFRVAAELRLENDDFTVRRIHGWLDRETLLLEGRQGLVAWRPDDGEMSRVVDVPASHRDDNWDVSVAPAAVAVVAGYGADIEQLRGPALTPVPVRPVPGVPAAFPAADAALPSVLEDPPGRVRIAYHPPEWWDDAVGWESETVLLLGTDDRWRRLALADLELPERAWPGRDTYGPGALSPDGRWWAGRSRIGVVLLDLGTGEHRLVGLDTDWVAQVKWLPDSSAFVVAYGIGDRPGLRAQRVGVPGLRRGSVPYEVYEVGFEPDGTPVTMRRTRAGDYELVASPGRREEVRASLSFPLPTRLDRVLAVHPTRGRYAVTTQTRGSRLLDLVVLDDATHEVEAVLRVDHGRVQLGDRWWLDPHTLLVQTRDGLVAWDLRAGSARPVAAGPERNGESWWAWTVDVATDLFDGSRG